MKKFSLIVACVLMTLSIVSCGNSGNAGSTNTATNAEGTASEKPVDKAIELTMAWWGNQTRNEITQKALDFYTEQNPNVIFDGQFSEWNDYWNKMATSAAGSSLPDIIQMDYKYLQQYADNGLLLDLTPYIENGTLDVSNVQDGILKSGGVGEGIYAIVNGVNAPALLYNKTLLDEHGITVKDNMTKDEFIDLCREVYEKTGYKTNISYNAGDNFIEYVMRGIDVQLFEDGKLGANNATELEEFFDYYEIGMEEGWHVDPSIFVERSIGSVEQDPLVYGNSPDTRSWCAFFYSNQIAATQNAAPDMELGITTWPSTNPIKSNYLKPSQFFAVTVDSENPEEAVKVLNYFTNSVECNEILLGERGIPASSVVAEAIAPLQDGLTNQVVVFINDVVTQNSSKLNPPAQDGASQVYDLIDRLQEELMYGQIDKKEAAERLFEQGNELMAISK